MFPLEVEPSAKSSRTMLCDQAKIPFLDALVNCGLQTVHDIWQFYCYGRALELSLNAGDTPMNPWETVIFGLGKIPGVRQTVRVPKDLLIDCHNARDSMLKIIGKSMLTSVSIFKKSLVPHVKNILSLDRFAILQLKYLQDHALDAATRKLQAEVLEFLPSSSVQPSFAEVLRFDSSLCCGFSCSCLKTSVWQFEFRFRFIVYLFFF